MIIFNTLKADFYRIIKSALGFYSIVGLMVLGLLFAFLGKDTSALETIESGLGNGTLLLPVFLTNVFVIAWGHEFSFRIVNNSLISGMKRSQFFISKVLLTFILTLIFVGMYTGSLLLGTYFFSGGFDIMPVFKVIALQIPLYLAAGSLGILLFNVLKTSYVCIAAFISIAFIGDNLLGNVISTYFSQYDFILDTLFFSNLRTVVGYEALSQGTLQLMIVSSVIYGFLALIVSFNVFQKREFK
ncbi:hypothetical protein [Enterococcus plantarum]|uniref:hypothetical protein n=1 Tax=Enterococcus TaxID=1350 RepID=UPI001A8EF768|nr:hypothetical protein [Enterococcus plantarum]MBO0421354.1 hypothetical protein [Enterococcus plantarum]